MHISTPFVPLIALVTTTLANPLHLHKYASSTPEPLNATATIISYFVATSCDSPFSQATQTLPSNVCWDLGEDDTTRSIALYDVTMSAMESGEGCTVTIWEDEKCESAYSEVVGMSIKSSEGNKTCIAQPRWGDGSSMMGSVKLVCV